MGENEASSLGKGPAEDQSNKMSTEVLAQQRAK